jgi:hypothetical protein
MGMELKVTPSFLQPQGANPQGRRANWMRNAKTVFKRQDAEEGGKVI